jgi:CHAD domain-containing protein
MTDFLLPEGTSAAAARRRLAARLTLRTGRLRECGRIYYDTFDGLLHDAGLVAVWEEGELALMERDSERIRARAASAKPGRRVFASELEPGPLTEKLRELIDVRALLPLVEIHTRERAFDVLDDERKTVVRIRLEQPTLGRRKLAPRVRLVPVRGYDKSLARVSETICSELGFSRAERTLVDEAVRATGGAPGGIPSKVIVPLAGAEPADGAAAAVLHALLGVIEANLAGTIDDLDSEFLHDLRVSVRRSRAVQREFGRLFGAKRLAPFRKSFRWLQEVTGDARDLDVYVLEFESMRALLPEPLRPDLDSLLAVLRDRRAGAHRRMVRALRSKRAAAILREWSSFLSAVERGAADMSANGTDPILAVAGERIRKVYRRMVKMGDAIDQLSPSAAYHELRKQGKELRYLLELFGTALYPDEVVRPMIKALKGLQDVLGRHQDREVQVRMLRSLREQVSAAPDGPAGLMAMGVLVERLEEDQHAARAAFAERFEVFASSRQRRVVKEVFATG